MKSKLKIDELLAAIILAVMSVIGFGNTMSRFIFHASLAATEEIEVNLFVWFTVLGIGLAFERGAHLGMNILFDKFPRLLKKIVIIISSSLSALIFVIVDYFAIREIYMDLTLFHMRSEALNIPNWIYTIGIPILSIFIFLRLYQSSTEKLKGLSKETEGER